MGPYSERLERDLKEAMKSRDAARLSTLRMLLSDLRSEAAREGKDLDEAREVEVLRRALKARRDAAESFEKGGRAESAAKERSEGALIETYLPKLLDAAATEAAARAIAAELGLTEKKDFGRLMKELMSRHKGVIDGRLAQEVTNHVLGG